MPLLSWLEHTKNRSAELSGRSEAPSYRIMGNCAPSREKMELPRQSFEQLQAMSRKEREGVDLAELRWVIWVP